MTGDEQSGDSSPAAYSLEYPHDTPSMTMLSDPQPRVGCEGCDHRMAQVEALVSTLREQQAQMVTAFNVIGTQQQEMWDGIGNLMRFFNSISGDLANMSLADKVKLASQLAKGGMV